MPMHALYMVGRSVCRACTVHNGVQECVQSMHCTQWCAGVCMHALYSMVGRSVCRACTVLNVVQECVQSMHCTQCCAGVCVQSMHCTQWRAGVCAEHALYSMVCRSLYACTELNGVQECVQIMHCTQWCAGVCMHALYSMVGRSVCAEHAVYSMVCRSVCAEHALYSMVCRNVWWGCESCYCSACSACSALKIFDAQFFLTWAKNPEKWSLLERSHPACNRKPMKGLNPRYVKLNSNINDKHSKCFPWPYK